MTLTAGSLFAGVGALDLAINDVLPNELAWYSEIDNAACAVMTERWPTVPNLGDISRVDWNDVPHVDILSGGFPCTDLSLAGAQAGLNGETRSGLWYQMAKAISIIKPDLVVIENVRGILSADAYCDVEPEPWGMGDGPYRPLRALGAVLGNLADLGYDARWCGLRASDIGAPHERFRIFVIAWPSPSDTDGGDNGGWSAAGFERQAGPEAGSAAHPDGGGGHWGADRAGWAAIGRTAPRWGPATDTDGLGPVRAGNARGRWAGSANHDQPPADTQSIRRGARWSGSAGIIERSSATFSGDGLTTDADGPGRQGSEPTERSDLSARRSVEWGVYANAIQRWERVLGRPAPAPIQRGKRGGRVLAPRFTEWMMGLPNGWITDVRGISREDQIKLCGNSVVTQQAVVALRHLMSL